MLNSGRNRPTIPARSFNKTSSEHGNEDLEYDCKAAYLVLLDDLQDEITSEDQLNQVLQQAGRNPSKRTLKKYWTRNTTAISFQEFCDICRKEPATSQDELMKAFKKIDTNGDGYLSNAELRNVLTTRGEKMSSAEVAAIIDEVDENKDGKLDYGEFCNMVLKTQQEAKQFNISNMERKMKGKNVSKPSSKIREVTSTSGSIRDITKLAITSKSLRLPKPKSIKEWQKVESKGSFFFEEDGRISSHQFDLEIEEDTCIWVTIKPISIKDGDLNSTRDRANSPIDTLLFILREDKSLVTFTELRDTTGKYGVRCDLDKGKYKLIPFTTGCRFRRRGHDTGSEVKLVKKSGDGYVLTSAFKDALGEIFDMCDLDGDGFLNRDEFNWFNVRTSGEEVNDEEWDVVKDNVTLEKGKLTKEGFFTLNQMEAEDNEGDAEDLWVTLSCMGFNKKLIIDEACPFSIEVFAEDTNAELKVAGIKQGGRSLETAIVESTIHKGEATVVKHTKDLTLHTYSSDFRACLVVENKSNNKVNLKLDCSKSKNCVSNRKSLEFTVDVPRKSVMVGHHLMPKKENQDWSIKVIDSCS